MAWEKHSEIKTSWTSVEFDFANYIYRGSGGPLILYQANYQTIIANFNPAPSYVQIQEGFAGYKIVNGLNEKLFVNKGILLIEREALWSPPNLKLNINGATKEFDKGWVNINGELKEIDKMWTNINGELKEI